VPRLCGLLLGIGLSSTAFAQDAHHFFPAPFDGDIRDPLTFERPGALHPGDFSIGAIFDYARQPVVQIVDSELGSTSSRVPVVDHLLALDLSVSVAANRYLRFEAAAPFYGFSVDQDGQLLGPTVGDTRISAVGLIIRPKHITTGGGFGLGLTAHGDIPTGNASRWVGRGGFAGGGAVIATYEFPWLTLSGAVGAQVDPKSDLAPGFRGQVLETSLDVGISASQASAFHLEARRSTPLQSAPHKGTGAPAEAILSYRYRNHGGLYLVVGAGAGLSEGIGSAKYRGFLGLGWGNMPDRRPPDTDAVSGFDATDACPGKPEQFNGWQDDDGCPDDLSFVKVHVTEDGEPVRGASVTVSGDSLEQDTYTSDAEGKVYQNVMPDTAVKASATMGVCLAGSGSVQVSPGQNLFDVPLKEVRPADVEVVVWTEDGKPIPTANVFWRVDDRHCAPAKAMNVDEQGKADAKMGVGAADLLVTAPEYQDFEQSYTFARGDQRVLNVTLKPKVKKVTRVRLEKKRIVILEKVHFEFGKAVIQPDSYPLLNDVADTIITNPQVGRIEVAGHTDSKGSDEFNMTLSQQRADAVRDYLVGRGVDPSRLISKGYGETRPIDTNKTEAGRENNRRVEFNLIDQEDEGEGTQAPQAPAPDGGTP